MPQFPSIWPFTLHLARLVDWASLYYSGTRGPREGKNVSCHVSEGLVSEVTQCHFIYILQVKASCKGKRNKLYVFMKGEANSPCKKAPGMGRFVAAIFVNNLPQYGWGGPRTLACQASPPPGDIDVSGQAHFENALGSSPLWCFPVSQLHCPLHPCLPFKANPSCIPPARSLSYFCAPQSTPTTTVLGVPK